MKLRHKVNPNNMTMQEHVHELRVRLFAVVITLVTLFICLYSNCYAVLDFLTELGKESGYTFVYISPQEVLLQQLRISFVLAILLSLPIIMYQVVAYIAPLFSDKRYYKAKALFGCFILLVLLAVGMLFAYKVLLPFTYEFLYGIGNKANIQSSVSIKEYVSLFLTVCICIGLVFELPFACIVLTRLGIINARIMKRGRKFMVVIAFVVGAVITPPDAISQVIVALPIITLYQVSIFICSFIGKESKYERSDYEKGIPTEVRS